MGIVNYRRAFFGLLLEDLEAADDRLHLRCELDTGRHVIALAALSPRAGQGRPEQTRRTSRPRTTRRARSDRIRRFGRRISLPTLAGPRCSRHSIRLNVLARHHPGVKGRPCRTLWRSQGPAEGTFGEGSRAPKNPSLLVMSLRVGDVVLQEVQSTSTSGGGLSGGALISMPVTSLTWARNQMLYSLPAVARSVNAFSMSGASNHTSMKLPIGVSCRAQVSRVILDVVCSASNSFRRSPMIAAAKSLPPCSLPGRIGNTPLNTAIGLFSLFVRRSTGDSNSGLRRVPKSR